MHNCVLICNGEIYNYKKLYNMCPTFRPNTKSDCEIILHMYNKYGMKHTLQHVDGVFSLVLFDHKKNCCYVARDTYGVRPMFYYNEGKDILFSSVLKSISKLNVLILFVQLSFLQSYA